MKTRTNRRSSSAPVDFERMLIDGTTERYTNRARRREIAHQRRRMPVSELAKNQDARRKRLAKARLVVKKMRDSYLKLIRARRKNGQA